MHPGIISSEKVNLFCLSLGFLKLLESFVHWEKQFSRYILRRYVSRVGKQSFPRISLLICCQKKFMVHAFKASVKICQIYDMKVK